RLLELHPLSAPELYSESLMREPRMTPRGPVTSPSPGRAITKSVSELFLTADSSCPNPQAATSPRGRAVTESSDRPLDKRSMPRSQTIQDIGQKEREEK
ncbi:MAG: hypothetical protein Q8P67_27785, partial [archaeon]|nr:hypothetical protein [archaeon]